MDMSIEIEDNDNCFGVPLRIFEVLDNPAAILRIKAYPPHGKYDWCRIVGWSSEGDGSPVAAFCVKVRDSGSGTAYLVYGGDWGVRLMAGGADEPWSVDSATQWGEPYMLLGDLGEVEAAARDA